ncbi:MAG: PAC2 family protein [Candidatus Nanopelagicales bacterium]|nr:PAC2 family protein [Candidatus Nanopelagicales bacterium]
MIEFDGLPELREPILLAAFEGWNDAGESASAAIEYLRDIWGAELLAEFDSEDYYDYQVNRPMVSTDQSGARQVSWPTTRVYTATVPGAKRDVVLLQGIEPNMRWQQFVREILGLCAELDVRMVATLGALLTDTPHTRPVPIHGTSTDAALQAELEVEVSTYEGPTGIVGVLQHACSAFGIPAVSIWASIPHYVSQPPNPKATLALIQRIEDVVDVSIPITELIEDARAWEMGVDELASEDDEVAEYVKQLEEARDAADLPEASGEAIAKEFERYLRRRGSN